jgi:hypothetical protein
MMIGMAFGSRLRAQLEAERLVSFKMDPEMLTLVSLMIALVNPMKVQGQIGLSGRWITEDTRLHPGGEAVPSALGAERLPRIPRQPKLRELVIEERADAVDVEHQPFNLMPMANQILHDAVHGKGELQLGPIGKTWYGTPGWAKVAVASAGGKAVHAACK